MRLHHRVYSSCPFCPSCLFYDSWTSSLSCPFCLSFLISCLYEHACPSSPFWIRDLSHQRKKSQRKVTDCGLYIPNPGENKSNSKFTCDASWVLYLVCPLNCCSKKLPSNGDVWFVQVLDQVSLLGPLVSREFFSRQNNGRHQSHTMRIALASYGHLLLYFCATYLPR